MSRIFRIVALNFQGKNLENVRRSEARPIVFGGGLCYKKTWIEDGAEDPQGRGVKRR
jgi:hypothetical protein